MLQAYLDGKNLITIKQSTLHYNGISSSFFLRNDDGIIETLMIQDKTTFDKYVEYKVFTKELNIGDRYDLIEEHGLSTHLNYRYVVHEEWFDKKFYNNEPLGINYSKENTTFKIWAPTASEVILKYYLKSSLLLKKMNRNDCGVYAITVDGDLDLVEYLFLVNVNGVISESIDPYGIASVANNKRSVVIDKSKIFKNDYQFSKIEPLDSIIYEISVRDISSSSTSNIKNKGKYLGLTEKNTKSNRNNYTGLSYIKDLGVTHVQLMPIYDFGSIDELNNLNSYNWGYDPVQYNVPEGSYSSNPLNPYSRVKECYQMIEALHQEGLLVVMDVVFNHVYDRLSSSLEKIVPYYYFRYDQKKNLSDGSFCHNDLESSRLMVRKYFIDSLVHWVTNYHVDGFRFDLMGIIDVRTMNEIKDALVLINPNIILYGEGWNMPTALDHEKKSAIYNSKLLSNIGFFNDRYREFMKGSTWSNSIDEKGFIGGNTLALHMIKNILSGSCTNIGNDPLLTNPNQSINYIESHDNRTVYDKLIISNIDESEEERLKRIKFSYALLMISQGIPFVHSGQEFARTKNGIDNSYNYPDDINSIDYDLRDKNIELVNYFKDCIELRKSEPLFRLKSATEIVQNLYFDTPDFKLLVYGIKSENKEYLILINALNESLSYRLLNNYQLIFDEKGFQKRTFKNEIKVEGISIKVLIRI